MRQRVKPITCAVPCEEKAATELTVQFKARGVSSKRVREDSVSRSADFISVNWENSDYWDKRGDLILNAGTLYTKP